MCTVYAYLHIPLSGWLIWMWASWKLEPYCFCRKKRPRECAVNAPHFAGSNLHGSCWKAYESQLENLSCLGTTKIVSYTFHMFPLCCLPLEEQSRAAVLSFGTETLDVESHDGSPLRNVDFSMYSIASLFPQNVFFFFAWVSQNLLPVSRLGAVEKNTWRSSPCRLGHNGGTWYPREVATWGRRSSTDSRV